MSDFHSEAQSHGESIPHPEDRPDPQPGLGGADPGLVSAELACPELAALESFLAADADELAALLAIPFSALRQRIDDLGFDSGVIMQGLISTELFTEDLWIRAVGLDLQSFLSLTPLQYCENFPEAGAPLVFAVLNAIRLNDEQSKLLATAGGTHLSKSDTIEIGVAAGITGLYVIPRALKHYSLKKELAALCGDDQTEIILPLNGYPAAGKLVKNDALGFDRLELQFATIESRVIFELKSTAPYQAYKFGAKAVGALASKLKLGRNLERDAVDDAAHDVDQEIVRSGDGRQLRVSVDRAIEHPGREAEIVSEDGDLDVDKLIRDIRIKYDIPDGVSGQPSLASFEGDIEQHLLDQMFFHRYDDFGAIEQEEVVLLENELQSDLEHASSEVVDGVDKDFQDVVTDTEFYVEEQLDADIHFAEFQAQTDFGFFVDGLDESL